MSSISEMHKAKAQSLFTHYMKTAIGYADSDSVSEWDEIIDRIIDAAVAEAKEIYAAPPAMLEAVQDDALDRIASALERIANVLGASSALSANAGAPRLPFEDIFS